MVSVYDTFTLKAKIIIILTLEEVRVNRDTVLLYDKL